MKILGFQPRQKINYSLYPPLKIADQYLDLRRKSIVRPRINTERFKDSFFNRLIFKYSLAV